MHLFLTESHADNTSLRLCHIMSSSAVMDRFTAHNVAICCHGVSFIYASLSLVSAFSDL